MSGAPAPAHACLEAFRAERDFLDETLRRLGAAPHEIEDLAHEVFLVLLRDAPNFDVSRPLRPRLFCIAFRIVRMHPRQPQGDMPLASSGARGSAADSGAYAVHLMPTLLDAARIVPRLPDVVRARAIVRARAMLATGSPFASAPTSRGRVRWLGIAVAVCLAFATGAAGATAALHGRGWRSPALDTRHAAAPPSASTKMATKMAETTSAPAPAPVSPASGPASRRKAARAGVPARRSFAAELECLQRAQVAFAGRDFPSALAAAAEHARRFPSGWLTEEREALRVRSLAEAGRADEARHAAGAFVERFPRSALLSRLRDTTGTD